MAVNKPVLGVAAAVIVIAAGSWIYLRSHHAPLPTVPEAASAVPPDSDAEPSEEHPLPANQEPATPLPALADSDAPLHDALLQLTGPSALTDYLRPENIVRNIVVTIDNLPRQKVAVEKRPLNPVSGPLAADGDELHATLNARNYERYAPLVAVVRHLDMQKTAALYMHYYPLFQQAYQNLGYPNGYFNDRLVQVIDVLLAAPQPAGAIELQRPNVMYTFADPALESRPAGQKLLVRMGPENEMLIKEKLMELRAIITAAPPKR